MALFLSKSLTSKEKITDERTKIFVPFNKKTTKFLKVEFSSQKLTPIFPSFICPSKGKKT